MLTGRVGCDGFFCVDYGYEHLYALDLIAA